MAVGLSNLGRYHQQPGRSVTRAKPFYLPILIISERGVIIKMEIKTKDLWETAFILARGNNLEDVLVNANSNGKREVIFILRREEIEESLREFRSGQAICNVSRLRASMIHLKDQMFRVIR